MSVKKLLISTIFFVMIMAWASSAIITVIPDSTSSKICHLGHYAHCSFTPYGIIISIVGAVFSYFIARKMNCLKF